MSGLGLPGAGRTGSASRRGPRRTSFGGKTHGVGTQGQDPWWESAACKGWNPSIFEAGDRTTRKKIERELSALGPRGVEARRNALALRACETCPVRRECLDDAVEAHIHAPDPCIRGGLLPSELQVERRRRKQEAKAVAA